MNMFENYTLTPNSYIPRNTPPKFLPKKQKYPLIAYNSFGEAIGYTWNYTDNICLEFNTTGNVIYDDEGVTEDAETYLNGKIFNVLIYNSRYECVAEFQLNAGASVTVELSTVIKKPLVPGVYTLQLTLIDENANTTVTLIDGNSGIIYIK